MNPTERRIKEYHIATKLLKYDRIDPTIVQNIIGNFRDQSGVPLSIPKNVYIDEINNISDTIHSTNSTNGCMIIGGGINILGNPISIRYPYNGNLFNKILEIFPKLSDTEIGYLMNL